MLSELRLDLDPGLEAPRELAPLIDPAFHSCGTVPPHGHRELAHPEPGFYVVGMKSYGRAPTFLITTGNEQVRSIAAALAGDVAGCRRGPAGAARDRRLLGDHPAERRLAAAGDGCCGTTTLVETESTAAARPRGEHRMRHPTSAEDDPYHRPLPEGVVAQGFPPGLPAVVPGPDGAGTDQSSGSC